MEEDFFNEDPNSFIEEDETNDAFPGTTHTDNQRQDDCQARFLIGDSQSNQLIHTAQGDFYSNMFFMGDPTTFRQVGGKDFEDQNDEDTTQPSPMPSFTPSTAETYQAPALEVLASAYNCSETEFNHSEPAPFEKIVCGGDGSLQNTALKLDSDHIGKAISKNNDVGITGCPLLSLDHTREFDMTMVMFQSLGLESVDLEMTSPKNPIIMNSAGKNFMEMEKKKANSNRQSKYKNAYWQVMQEVKRLLQSWLNILMGCGTKKLKQEEEKSDSMRIIEEKQILIEYEEWEAVKQKIEQIKDTIMYLEKRKGTTLEDKAELNQLIKEKDVLQCRLDKEKKALEEKLQYKRLGVIPCLSHLINSESTAFIKISELKELLEGISETSRKSLAGMMKYFKEKINFGLLVLRVAIELLSETSEENSEWGVSRTNLAQKYWLVKTRMDVKSRSVFLDKKDKNHVQNEFKKLYFELEEFASKTMSRHHSIVFQGFLEDYGKRLAPISSFEREVYRRWLRKQSGKCSKEEEEVSQKVERKTVKKPPANEASTEKGKKRIKRDSD